MIWIKTVKLISQRRHRQSQKLLWLVTPSGKVEYEANNETIIKFRGPPCGWKSRLQ